MHRSAVISSFRFDRSQPIWGDKAKRPGRIPQKPGAIRENPVRISAQTSNFYLAAMKQFANWMQVDRQMADNPLLGLKGKNVALDRRHDRRALTDDEFAKLIKAASKSKDAIEGLTGVERSRIYMIAFATGLRRAVSAGSTVDNFALVGFFRLMREADRILRHTPL